MKVRIKHSTRYIYSEPVAVSHNVIRLIPRDTALQSVISSGITIEPMTEWQSQRRDYFGNSLMQFSVRGAHSILELRAVSELCLSRYELPASSPAWDTLAAGMVNRSPDATHLDTQFRFWSPRVTPSRRLLEYANPLFACGQPVLEAIKVVIGRICNDFCYDPASTTVDTPLDDVIRTRRGVCQDFAHVAIGCFRAVGLSARYVSGYVPVVPAHDAGVLESHATHAWVSVFCGNLGWVDFDPTNNLIAPEGYATLAWGRDYSDVSPAQGIYTGAHNHTVTTAVTVPSDDD